MKPLVLASESPRRRELLQRAGFCFEVVSVKVSEIPDKNLNINEQILDIAQRKAQAALTLLKSSKKEDFLVLAADTEVIFAGGPLGKPQNENDAYRMLKLLSGQSHEVKTAVWIIDSFSGQEISHIETTQIQFKKLSDEEIWAYIGTGEPMDKAGAYGIQGLGRNLVQEYSGSFENVVGLPTEKVREMLSQFTK